MERSPAQQTAQILPSNRSFGLLFAGVFAVASIWPLLFDGTVRIWSVTVSAAFGVIALLAPNVLTPLNRGWMHIGALLHRIMSPVLLAFIFFAVLTPFGLAMRAAGRRPLALFRDASADTYWVRRESPGPEPESLRNQF